MMSKPRVFGVLAVLAIAGIALLGPTPSAHATLVLEGTITPAMGPGVTIWATDNNVAYPGGAPAGSIQLLDISPNVGDLVLAAVNPFPGYSVSFSESTVTKGGVFNAINSSALQITNTTGGTVMTSISVGDNDFIGPQSTASIASSTTWQTAIGSTIGLSWYDDPTNTQPLLGGVGPIGQLVGSTSHTVIEVADSFSFKLDGLPVSDPSNFAMTLHFEFSLVDGGTLVSRGQNELKAIPEPGTVFMALSGLSALGLFWVRRRRHA